MSLSESFLPLCVFCNTDSIIEGSVRDSLRLIDSLAKRTATQMTGTALI